MGEGVGDGVSLAACLESVVADGGGCVHGFFDVARLEDVPALLRVECPDACEEIGLEFEADRKVAVLGFGDSALGGVDAVGCAEQVLDVMTDFVRGLHPRPGVLVVFAEPLDGAGEAFLEAYFGLPVQQFLGAAGVEAAAGLAVGLGRVPADLAR